MLVACLAGGSGAQNAPRSIVRVRLTDSSGVRIEGAELTIVRGLHDTVATGATSARGEWSTIVPRSSSPYQLIARKIGFGRQHPFFMATGDSVVVAPRMGRIVQALAEVIITEKEDAVRKSYFIDADDIANSPRPLVDASDILLKLKPDMIYGRSGKGTACGIENIWINGIAVYRTFKAATMSAGPRARGGVAAGAQSDAQVLISDMARERVKKGGATADLGAARLTVLETIKPEHIEQITYKDCFDTSVKGNFTKNALYIVLKPGIKYERGVGSYALEGGRTAR
jgi:hypothetical protein